MLLMRSPSVTIDVSSKAWVVMSIMLLLKLNFVVRSILAPNRQLLLICNYPLVISNIANTYLKGLNDGVDLSAIRKLASFGCCMFKFPKTTGTTFFSALRL